MLKKRAPNYLYKDLTQLGHGLAAHPSIDGLGAKVVCKWLDSLPAGGRLDLYGCGKLGRDLALNWPETLRRHNVSFLITSAEGEKEFHGFPLRDVVAARKDPADNVLILSYAYEAAMLSKLDFMASGSVCTLPFALSAGFKNNPGLVEEAMESSKVKISSAILEINKIANGRKVICFVIPTLSHHLTKLIYEIRQRGYAVALLLQNPVMGGGGEVTSGPDPELHHCDYVYLGAVFYPYECISIINSCDIHAVHLVSGSWGGISGAAIVQGVERKIVTEYCDFKEIVLDDPQYAMRIYGHSKEQYNLECEAQRIIFTQSDGIIYKDGPEAVRHLSARYGKRPASELQFMHYCGERYLSGNVESKLSAATGRPHIVLCMYVVNDPDWPNYPLCHSLLEAARTLDAQGIFFDIYNGVDSNGKGFEEYTALASELKYFNYHFSVPYEELKFVLPRYDYGWFCFDYARARETRIYIETTMGSKIFTYLEANLPVIISPEVKFAARTAVEMGIGIPVAYNELHQLGNILEGLDKDAMREKLSVARKKYTYDANIQRLLDFYAAS